MDKTSTEKLRQRGAALKQERSSWVGHWQEISEYLLPRSGRFFVQDANNGTRRYNRIYDSTGTRALRILAAGMMSGMTSPARPWFKLSTPDTDLNRYAPVKDWLHKTTLLMRDVFARSNSYRALHAIYSELGAFGTSASIIDDNFDKVIHHHPLTTGEFCIATNPLAEVRTLYREFQKTVGDLVLEFGIENVSPTVKTLFDNGAFDTWVPVAHIIEPRALRDPRKRDNKNMPFASYYYELGADKDTYLRESGYELFPAVAPRWDVSGGDIYGNSPGMEALGDIKQLQQEQLRKAQGIDYMTKPPLQAPASTKGQDEGNLPGGVVYHDSPGPGVRTQFEVRLDLNHLLADIQDVRERVRGAFYADLFMMLANGANTRMTATEVAERHEEKLLMLGPVVERLHNELLDQKVDITFSRMLKAGIVPPVPDELNGMDLNIEYVSIMAQAQRAVGTNSIDRFVGNLGAIASMKPDVLDKFDADEWAESYSEMLGVDPDLIVPAEQVALVRKSRAQAQAQAAQQEQALAQSQVARNVSQIDTQAQDVMGMFSGYSTPGG